MRSGRRFRQQLPLGSRAALGQLALMLVVIALLLPAGSGAEARTRGGNGWEAGSSSDTITGRVGKKKGGSAAKPSGAKGTAKRCTSRTCKSAPKRSSAGGDAEAMKTVKLPPPLIRINPERVGLPGVTTLLWAVLPSRVDFDLSIDGITTRLTGAPIGVTWYVSDGRVQSGTPVNGDEADSPAPTGGTAVEFDLPGTYQLTAVVDWHVSWSTNEGESGTVEGRQSSAVAGYQVGERRSVLAGAKG